MLLSALKISQVLLSAVLMQGSFAAPDLQQPLYSQPVAEITSETEVFANMPDVGNDPDKLDPDTFSICWITDTQGGAYSGATYTALAEFINKMDETHHFEYLVGTGDFIDIGDEQAQWDNFNLFSKTIKKDIPTMYVAGNHDTKHVSKDHLFTLNNLNKYADAVPEDQQRDNGYCQYSLFTAGNRDWIMLGMGYGYGDEEIEWAKSVFQKYPDRLAIVLTHEFLSPLGMPFGNAQRFLNAMKDVCPNVRLVLCGHAHRVQTYYRPIMTDLSHYVRAILSDFQGGTSGSLYCQILRIEPSSDEIHMDVYEVNPDYALKAMYRRFDTDFSE